MRSIFGERLEDALIEHDLVDEVPVPDQVRLQDLKHRCLVGSIVDRVVGPQVPVASQGSLTAVLEDLYLVEQFIIALVVGLWDFLVVFVVVDGLPLLIGFLLDDLLRNGLYLVVGVFFLHAIVFVNPEPSDIFL